MKEERTGTVLSSEITSRECQPCWVMDKTRLQCVTASYAADSPESLDLLHVRMYFGLIVTVDRTCTTANYQVNKVHSSMLLTVMSSLLLALIERQLELDLLFTDVIMPGGINGPELAKRGRAIRPGITVLCTSGYTENAIIHHGRLDEGVQLLSKPYRKQELAAKLREVLTT